MREDPKKAERANTPASPLLPAPLSPSVPPAREEHLREGKAAASLESANAGQNVESKAVNRDEAGRSWILNAVSAGIALVALALALQQSLYSRYDTINDKVGDLKSEISKLEMQVKNLENQVNLSKHVIQANLEVLTAEQFTKVCGTLGGTYNFNEKICVLASGATLKFSAPEAR